MVRLLSAADRPAQPWKNGGGTTSDVAIFPAGTGLDDFGWRLSIAEVAVAGPFSHFAGIDRSLSVLEGRLELEIDGHPEPVRLTAEDGACRFLGDVAVAGRPLSGRVRDLNLMLRHGLWGGSVERLTAFPMDVVPEGIDVMIVVATGSARIGDHRLGALDALLADPPEPMRIEADAPVHLIRLWRA